MEPRPLQFGPSSPPAAAPARSTAVREPGAVVFPASPTPAPKPGPSRVERPAAVSAPALGPAPLVLPDRPVTPPVAPRPAFARPEHPLTATVRKRAQEFAPELARSEQERLDRSLAKLLPLTLANCEDWGNRAMDDCRHHANRCAELTAQFNALGSAHKLEQVFRAAAPADSALEKLRRRLSGTSVAEHSQHVQHVRGALEAVLRDIRDLRPKVSTDGPRLAVKVLAFRAVVDATGIPSDPTFETIIERRRRVLTAALQQAEMLGPQLQALEQSAALQLSQCDQLLNVTLPALRLAASKG